ncbi:MAG: TraB/GumN family protein [Saprospiraceae bacterium]|nr:TraB/GumN family protein [Saprospiraceae bacterium]MCB0543293.1 TraB/GumN family protein [Saprospiraceae bacterium]
MKNYWLWLLPALAALGCTASKKMVYPADQIIPSEKSLVWKISGNGLKKPSYLYGTIHLIPKSDFNLPESAREALDRVRRVAFEIDMKEMTNFRTQIGLMSKAFMPGGKTLKDLLPEEDYRFVKAKMDEKGLPGGFFERMKPMFLSTMFSSDEDAAATTSDRMTSVEMELYRMTRRRDLESAGLETAAYQMAIFDSIPYEAQAKMLVETLRSTEGDQEGEGELAKMIALYLSQDINAMQTMIGDSQYGMDGYEDILLKNRNRNWIPIMGRLMREAPTLFAVGAGHLGGESGVVALLRREGYRVDAL